MTTKEILHRLIDELSDDDVAAVERLLVRVTEGRVDRTYLGLLAALPDDEPSTPDEDRSTAEAWQEYRRGEIVSNSDLRREIGW